MDRHDPERNDAVRSLSERLAQMTTRRGFLAGLMKAAFTVGAAAGVLYGADLPALAGPNNKCTGVAGDGQPGSTCGGAADCTSSGDDSHGCTVPTVPLCSGCQNGGLDCPSGSSQTGWWTCCCNSNTLTTCTDCSAPGGGLCICEHVGDPIGC